MLHILAWLAVLSVALFALGEAIRPWRKRRWFKLVFFPGVLLAIGVQVLAARLCVEAHIKRSPLGEGDSAFFIEKTDLPPVAGALFVLLSHAFTFVFFALVVILFRILFGLDPAAIQLCSLYPARLSADPLHVSAVESGAGSALAPYFLLVYFFAPVFSNLRLRGREYLVAGLFLFTLGWIDVGNLLGLETSSQSWSSRLFLFPPWWGIFSLYVLAVLFTLAVAVVARGGRLIVSAPAVRRRGAQRVKLGHVDNEPLPESDKEAGEIVYE